MAPVNPASFHHGSTTPTTAGAPAPACSMPSPTMRRYRSQLTEDWCGAMTSTTNSRTPAVFISPTTSRT